MKREEKKNRSINENKKKTRLRREIRRRRESKSNSSHSSSRSKFLTREILPVTFLYTFGFIVVIDRFVYFVQYTHSHTFTLIQANLVNYATSYISVDG